VYLIYSSNRCSGLLIEEIDENIDPFLGTKIMPDTGGSGGRDSDTINHIGDMGNIGDVVMEDAPACKVPPDLVVDSECEDSDLEDEDGDEEPLELNRQVTVELGLVPPRPSCDTGDRQPPYTAGCVWTEEDWSCSYDAVFMAFWSLYEQSSPGWRNDWVRLTPEWNIPLSDNFNHLILLANTPIDVRDRTKWFSRYRDRFRDQLSLKEPGSFPRRGPHPASASRILEITFGRTAGPYLVQHLICQACGAPSQTERELCFITIGHSGNDKSPISLRAIWEEFVRDSETNPARLGTACPHCQGPNQVEILRMPDVPWIWFERDRHSPVRPSLTLTFDSPPEMLSYSLRAIIYAGGDHFTVRFRERSGRWWRHDGRLASGVPQPDNIQSEEQLLMNGTRFACTLIYHRDGH
jgi:hypothetical protein